MQYIIFIIIIIVIIIIIILCYIHIIFCKKENIKLFFAI